MATEEAEKKEVVVVEAKEVDGKAVAEDRSDAALLDDSQYPEDQMAVESIDRDLSVYVPPPANLVHGPIPVPVSMAAKPGSLVLPGLPQPRRGPPVQRRPFPRRPPAPLQKRPGPYPVRPNYAPPPSLSKTRREHSPVPPLHPGFIAPPPVPQLNYAPPPPPSSGDLPPHLQQQHQLQLQQQQQHQLQLQQQQQHQLQLQQQQQQQSSSLHSNPDFGNPKNNDLLEESESSLSSVYSGPPPPPLPVATAPVEGYVPPSLGESRKPIINAQDHTPVETGLANAYVPPTGGISGGGGEPWPVSAPDMAQIVALDVKCEKNLMKVRIEFDKPFNGIIFSKGHYSNVHCVHLPAGLGRTHATFDISISSCGTSGNTDNGLYGYGSQSGSGTYFENTIVIQYDPQVQEVWDGARKLRCTWHDQYEKSVTFRPFSVDMLDVVRADFAGDNVGCWMQIQVGKGPWASEVSGLVKIGQTMTMVLAIKDDDNKFDMLVRNCMAHDGKRAPIQLVDQRGCITRPKLMSRFTKIKDFGASASVLSYAHFQAFKFPDSMEVHFQCTIQICRYQCPEQCSEAIGGGVGYHGSPREKREVTESVEDGKPSDKQADVGVNRVIQVVSTRDLTFILDKNGVEEEKEVTKETLVSTDEHDGLICMSTPGFAATLVVLLGILIVSCLLSAFLCMRLRITPSARSFISSSYDNPAFLRKPGCFDYH